MEELVELATCGAQTVTQALAQGGTNKQAVHPAGAGGAPNVAPLPLLGRAAQAAAGVLEATQLLEALSGLLRTLLLHHRPLRHPHPLAAPPPSTNTALVTAAAPPLQAPAAELGSALRAAVASTEEYVLQVLYDACRRPPPSSRKQVGHWVLLRLLLLLLVLLLLWGHLSGCVRFGKHLLATH